MSNPVLALAPAILGEAADWLSPIGVAASIVQSSGAGVTAILVGGDDVAARAALMAGANAAWIVSHPGLAEPADIDQVSVVFAEVLSRPDWANFRLALLPAGPFGDTIAATLAIRLDGAALGLCADVTLTDIGVIAHRPAYGGRAQMTLTTDARCFAAMRAPKARGATSVEGPVHHLELANVLPTPLPIARRDSGLRTSNLEGANVVVSGGRGMGGEEGFSELNELATCLGGALGGSLPTVDAGWAPVSRQVGQSGKFVTPEVYVAVGISGTPQHMAGIGSNVRIVAINKDAEADIFRFAEIGIVADWKEVLPGLIGRLREGRRAASAAGAVEAPERGDQEENHDSSTRPAALGCIRSGSP